ncbi:VOC family protein [Kitasatospora sp. NPDC058032]|uniref:VOC family protein n=1 Tax=Kitasatospora sp. NPDC058032 TaxID=3346307 RepID=UPI0036DD4793
MAVHAELAAITVDCADPRALADFYRKVTGWEIAQADDDFVQLGQGPIQLAFQRVAGYRGPGWPDTAKHAHLDFTTADLEVTVKELLSAGATLPEFQPGEGQWTVLADPEGHLFCLASV